MIIKRIKLQNFAQHRSVDKEIKGNLIGVLGKNGCGKTNFLNAIRFAFTGDADGTKESMISQGLPEADRKGNVELWFSAHGKDGYIKRALHSQTRTFTYGDTTYKKDAEINTALKELFGMDKDMLRNLTFIRQGELQKLLFGDPAERESNFIKIFGLGHTEAIRATLLSKVEMLEHHVVDLTQLVDENRVSLQKQEEIVKELEGQAEGATRLREDWAISRSLYESVVEIDKQHADLDSLDLRRLEILKGLAIFTDNPYVQDSEISKCRDLVVKLDSEITTSNETAKNVHSRDQLRVDRAQCVKNLEAQAEKESGTSAPLAMLPDASDAEDLSTKLERSSSLLDLIKMHSENGASLARQESQLAQINLDIVPCREGVETLSARITEAVEALSRIKQTRDQNKKVLEELLTKPDGCECPFCISKITNVSALVAIVQDRVKDLEYQLSVVSPELASRTKIREVETEKYHGMVRSQNSLRKDIQLTQLNMASALKDIEALKGQPVFETASEIEQQRLVLKDKRLRKTLEEMLKIIQGVTAQEKQRLAGIDSLMEKLVHVPETAPDVTAVTAQLHHVKQWLADSDMSVRTMNNGKGALQQADEDRERLKASIKGQRSTAADIAILKTNLQNAEQRWQASQEIVGRLEQARQAANGFKLRLSELEGNMERGKKTSDLVKEFKKVREVLERRNLPLTFIQQYFKRLLPMVQGNLGTVGADFIVKSHPTDPVSFIFDRTDGTCNDAPVEKLSGGQKVRLVVAFLFALHEVMSNRMGFLVLDEPTVFLDDTGVESFGELLSDIVIRLQSSDMQVLISTHEQSLKPNFSSCIQIGNAVST